jgi:hypothetical protein
VKEADALASAGYEVSVVAADYALWARECDREFDARSWQVVRKLAFGPHAPRLPRLLQITRQRLARLMLRVGNRNPAVIHAAWHPIAPDLIAAAEIVPADLYIAHYPAALPAAAIAARRIGASYAYDAEDFHLGDTPEDAKYKIEREIVRTIEELYVPGAAYVTAASPGIANAYAEAYGISRPTVLLNVFPRSQGLLRPRAPAMSPSLYWVSQTIGPDRGLECAMRAIGLARSRPHLYLRGSPAAGFVERLRVIAREGGSEARLHILPPTGPREMERAAAIYDLGFSGEPGHTSNNRIALGNKLFTYLLAGIPIVMSDVPAHQAIASTLGDAARIYSAEDSADLAAQLDALFCNPASIAAARDTAWQLGQKRYNWDLEQSKLLNCVSTVTGGPKVRMDNAGIPEKFIPVSARASEMQADAKAAP